MKYYKILLILFIITLILKLSYKFNYTNVESFENDNIPKKIWTFWDGDIPEIVNKCIGTWKKYNPNYEIIVLNKENINNHLPNINFSSMKNIDSPEHFSDVVRIHILAKEGGIWCDASIICLKSFDWVHELRKKENTEFVGFFIDSFTLDKYKKTSPVIENWFFACKKGSQFLCDWRDEFTKITTIDSRKEYIDEVKKNGTDIQNISSPEYLTMHVSAQKVLQSDKKYKLSLLKAEDEAFKYLTQNDWDSKKAVKNLLDCNDIELYESSKCEFLNGNIIKLRGIERKELNNLNPPNSFFDKF
jgi:hypothetical protein